MRKHGIDIWFEVSPRLHVRVGKRVPFLLDRVAQNAMAFGHFMRVLVFLRRPNKTDMPAMTIDTAEGSGIAEVSNST